MQNCFGLYPRDKKPGAAVGARHASPEKFHKRAGEACLTPTGLRGVRRFSTNYPLPDARLCEKIFSPGLSCVKSLSLAVFRTLGAAPQTLSGRFSFCSRAADP
jgi:hypothetical protein